MHACSILFISTKFVWKYLLVESIGIDLEILFWQSIGIDNTNTLESTIVVFVLCVIHKYV